MPELGITRVNGVPYSWTSLSHFFTGLPYKGVLAVSYKETREVKIVHAAQQDGTPIGITSGIYKVENVSFRLLREQAGYLMQDLTVLGVGSFGDAQFTYTGMLYEPVGQLPPAAPITTTITGCRITGVEEKAEMGTDELVTEFTCSAMFLIRTVGGVPLKLWSTVRSLL
jgi:hypothetical protein